MLLFCVFDSDTNTQVGMISIKENCPQFLRAEIGSLTFSPIVQGTGASLEACYLLLGHLFGLGYRRIELMCDAKNKRAFQFALKVGFRFEVVFEQYLIYKERNGDIAWFRMLDYEWEKTRKELENKLYQ
jgi:RimJ/RimL family protein N-acetyltransferase